MSTLRCAASGAGRTRPAAGRVPSSVSRNAARNVARNAARTVALVAGAAASLAPVGALRAQPPVILSEAPLTGKGVEFHAVIHPETVYVGQQANYQVGVFLGDDVRARLRRNPEFVPPEMSGVLGYDLPVTHVLVPDRSGGRYEAHVFERAVFPLTAGVHAIPAARLSYSLPLNRSFFSREESFLLRSEPVSLVAVPTPEAGRPEGFDGAVGSDIEVALAVDSAAAARVGDPLLVTARVSGRGNVNLYPRPRLEVAWATLVATGERVRLDSTSRSIAGVKEFDWLLTPRREGGQQLPSLTYHYFDPESAAYRSASSAPRALVVARGTLAALDTVAAPGREPLSIRERWRGALPLPPASSPLYWLAVVLLPIPPLWTSAGRGRARERRRGASAADMLADFGRPRVVTGRGAGAGVGVGSGAGDVRELRAVFVRALAERLALDSLSGGDRRRFVRQLRLEGVGGEVALEAAALLEELDRLAYSAPDGGGQVASAALVDRARRVARAVDAEARLRPTSPARPVRGERGAWTERDAGARDAGARDAGARDAGLRAARVALLVGGVAAAAMLGASGALATQLPPRPVAPTRQPPAAEFARAVALYQAGDFPGARAGFAVVAASMPRAADAWANSGTAAWAEGDTAGAALGWQRALRLEPAARDVRQRLALLPGDQLTGFAAVPPVSPAALQWLALIAWAAAAALALRSSLARRPRPTAALGALVAVAAVGGGASALAAERLAARDLAVVAQGTALRDQPALSAAARRPLAAGEVVRIRARNGVWIRVQSGADAGWVEHTRIRELGAGRSASGRD